jgi:putative nucleotidyltransferase with HDIG domain
MDDENGCMIDISELQIGMFVHLDLGWTEHPFPLNRLKIRSLQQLRTIRSLGLARIRYFPEKSDPAPSPERPPEPGSNWAAQADHRSSIAAKQKRRDLIAMQQANLEVCERRFAQAARGWREIQKLARDRPDSAMERTLSVISAMTDEMLGDRDVNIRLLSEQATEINAQHALNVTVLAMLVGKALGLPAQQLQELGCGALLHDIGKLALPERIRWNDRLSVAADRRAYQEHVGHGVVLGRAMKLPMAALATIAGHHEAVDGSGYPEGVDDTHLSVGAKIVAVVNVYDNACNPFNPAHALTPHEALSNMFARMRARFDPGIMTVFIRLMGVYPPGSVVQLDDGRHALVVSVNSSRPLKPCVLIHEPGIPREDAMIVDLEESDQIGITQSLKPAQLPRRVFDYLSPRQRTCYFFERARTLPAQSTTA